MSRDDGGAGGLGLHRPGFAPQATDAGIRIQADHQPVALTARLLQQVDVAGVQQVETAIGEANAPALPAPALDLLGRSLAGDDLAQRAHLRRQHTEQVFAARDRRADLADDDACREVGQAGGHAHRQSGRQPGGQCRHDGVARAGHVEHVDGLGRKVMRAVRIDQRQAVLRARHQHGAEAVELARMGRGTHEVGLVGDRHAGGFTEFAAVGRDDVRAGVAREIVPLGVDHDRPSRLSRQSNQLGRNVSGQHALGVIGQNRDRRRGHRVTGDAQQAFGQFGAERLGLLAVGAEQLLTLTDEAGFDGGGAGALDQHPGLDAGLPADEPGQVRAGLIVADDGHEGDGRA